MKKLGKLSLSELKTEMPVISKEGANSLTGGSEPSLIGSMNIDGGTIFSYQYPDGTKYSVYASDYNNPSVYLDGVSVTDSLVKDDAAYQLDGVIHIGSEWAGSGFTLKQLMHEYGHYLQQSSMGSTKYFNEVVRPSLYSATVSPSTHAKQPYELNADKRAKEYYLKNVGGTY